MAMMVMPILLLLTGAVPEGEKLTTLDGATRALASDDENHIA